MDLDGSLYQCCNRCHERRLLGTIRCPNCGSVERDHWDEREVDTEFMDDDELSVNDNDEPNPTFINLSLSLPRTILTNGSLSVGCKAVVRVGDCSMDAIPLKCSKTEPLSLNLKDATLIAAKEWKGMNQIAKSTLQLVRATAKHGKAVLIVKNDLDRQWCNMLQDMDDSDDVSAVIVTTGTSDDALSDLATKKQIQSAVFAMPVFLVTRRSEKRLCHGATCTLTMETTREAPLCSICTDAFGVGETTITLPCSHLFHETCICKWLKRHDTCPCCRTTIKV